jgi:hypothetical protein
MGFLDKAKKMAEQAQTKLDEVQKQFNEGQGGSSGGPEGAPVEYDQHGRPIRSESAGPPAQSAPPPPAEPASAPPAEPVGPPPAGPTPPHGDPLAPSSKEEGEQEDEHAPPKLPGGDPLAG